jgi:hypothetical protein
LRRYISGGGKNVTFKDVIEMYVSDADLQAGIDFVAYDYDFGPDPDDLLGEAPDEGRRRAADDAGRSAEPRPPSRERRRGQAGEPRRAQEIPGQAAPVRHAPHVRPRRRGRPLRAQRAASAARRYKGKKHGEATCLVELSYPSGGAPATDVGQVGGAIFNAALNQSVRAPPAALLRPAPTLLA